MVFDDQDRGSYELIGVPYIYDVHSVICCIYLLGVQSPKKWLVRGLVKFLLAVPQLLCLALSGSFLTMFCKPFFRALYHLAINITFPFIFGDMGYLEPPPPP